MTDPGVFDEYAAAYDETVQAALSASGESVAYFAELKADLTRRAASEMRPRHVLDFGCGVGNATRALGTRFPAARVTGFDLSSRSVEVAERITPRGDGRIRYVSDDRGGLPFADGSFDLAFTSCVFHHIERAEQPAWTLELLRVLRPGGALLVFEHNPYNPLTRQVVRNIPFDRGVRLLRPGYTVRLLRAAGFAPERPWFYFFFPRVLRALRPLEPLLRRVPVGAQYFVLGRRPAEPRA